MGLKKENTDMEANSKIEENFELKNSYESEGQLLFKKPKKYEVIDEKVTKIIVTDRNGEKEISKQELADAINSNKKLNKIVIEEVNVNDVKRTNLIFDNNKKVTDQKFLNKDLNIMDLEKNINKDFFNGSIAKSKNILTDDFATALNYLKEFDELKSQANQESSTKVEKKNEKISLFDEFQSHKVEIIQDANFKESTSNSSQKIEEKKEKNEDVEVFSNLSLGDDEIDITGSLSDSDKNFNSDDEYDLKDVKISRHELKRKNNKSLSKLYYRVNNHIELFKLGDSYLRDFNRGVRSLGFHSVAKKDEREKTVLGVTSFLNYNAKITVTVITENLKNSIYAEYINALEEVKKTILNENIAYTSYVTQGVEFVEFSELCDVMYQLGNTSFEEFIENFIENSEVVLWDLPELKEMDNKKELYYPIIRSIESVSLVVEENESRYKQIIFIKDYFDKYKVPFKGFVVSPS